MAYTIHDYLEDSMAEIGPEDEDWDIIPFDPKPVIPCSCWQDLGSCNHQLKIGGSYYNKKELK